MDYLFEILLLIIAVIPSILTYRIKGQITHEFDRKLEEYKQQLEEDNIAFGTLHPKRVEAAEALYSLMQDVIQLDKEATTFGVLEGQEGYLKRFQALCNRAGELDRLIPKYRIYLSKEEFEQISSLSKHWMMELWKWQTQLKDYVKRDAFKDAIRDAHIAFMIDSLETRPQIERIELMFQKMVGLKK